MQLIPQFTRSNQNFDPVQLIQAALQLAYSGRLGELFVPLGGMPAGVNGPAAFLHVNVGCLSERQQQRIAGFETEIAKHIVNSMTPEEREDSSGFGIRVGLEHPHDQFEVATEVLWITDPTWAPALVEISQESRLKLVGLLIVNVLTVNDMPNDVDSHVLGHTTFSAPHSSLH